MITLINEIIAKEDIKRAYSNLDIAGINCDITSDLYSDYDLVIDQGLCNDEITFLNKKNCYKISINIPSGINQENGLAKEIAFKTNLVIEAKITDGLYLNDALDYYDEVRSLVRLNKRKSNSNKGSYGKCLIIAGSKDYSGAPLISFNSLVSFKMGIGYQALAIPSCIFDYFVLKNPEILLYSLSDDGNRFVFNEEEISKLLSYDAIALGMGMTVSSDLCDLITYLINNYSGRLIIDADGLNTISKYNIDLHGKPEIILTPHLKEFSRLSGYSVEEIKNNGIKLAMDYCKRNNCVMMLKSNSTIIADGNNYCISANGNSGLAKAGSGDMLSGILLGLCGHKEISCYNASYLASYILGEATKQATKNENEYTVTASDIIKMLPSIIDKVINHC